MHNGLIKSLLQVAKLTGKHPPKRLPRQVPGLAIEREYGALIKGTVLETVLRLLRARLLPRVEELTSRGSRITQDAGESDLGDIFDAVFEEYLRQWPRSRVGDLARREGRRMASFHAAQLNQQLRPALGLDVVGNEPWLAPAIEEFTRENVALIKSIPDDLLSSLETMVSRDLADGVRFEELAVNIEEKFDVAKRRAELIARDQMQKFQGDLNRVRQQDLGVTKYVWNTLGDESVRPEHVARDGKIFSWSDAPEDGHPGEAINCRCWAEPILDD